MQAGLRSSYSSMYRFLNNRFLLLVIGALAISAVPSLPVRAAERPVRWNTGGAVWSTTQDDMKVFLQTGEITDRGLAGGLRLSGWASL